MVEGKVYSFFSLFTVDCLYFEHVGSTFSCKYGEPTSLPVYGARRGVPHFLGQVYEYANFLRVLYGNQFAYTLRCTNDAFFPVQWGTPRGWVS